VPASGGTFVAWEHVVERLDRGTAYWLATVTPNGRPHVVPIWGVLVEQELYLETGAPDTAKNRNLGANEEVVVHLDDADDLVIVREPRTVLAWRDMPTATRWRLDSGSFTPAPEPRNRA
jgi:nitroimidazol reductase NimA-like FMN-containing flavoprotein (pyridoxamine 5'-phosphate oxidase superfamily)